MPGGDGHSQPVDLKALGPFAGVVEAVDALVQRRLQEAVGDLRAVRAAATAEALLAALDDGLHPDHDYLPAQAAEFLGLKKTSYDSIPRSLLPRRKGGFVRGVDLMAYRGDVTREEAEAYKAAKRESVTRAIR